MDIRGTAGRLLRWRNRAAPDRGQRGLVVVSQDPDGLADRVSQEFVDWVLAAATAAGVADVAIDLRRRHGGRELAFRVRAIDRGVMSEFAKLTELTRLRHRVESTGGQVTAAHSRFAVFHLTLELPDQ